MILDDIANATRKRVDKAKVARPLEVVRDEALALVAANDSVERVFEDALRKPGISFICEVKRASPSKGLIAPDFSYLQIAQEYEKAGAAAISVLTEPDFFMGKDEYLQEIAAAVHIPLLRKDFIIDPYQIYDAKLLGASAILLICALLDIETLRNFLALADSLKLSCLVEVHSTEEVQLALDAGARVVGINNRDLKTFQVDLGLTSRLRNLIPAGIITVSESGVKTPADIHTLAASGIDGVLVGEALMRVADKRKFLEEAVCCA